MAVSATSSLSLGIFKDSDCHHLSRQPVHHFCNKIPSHVQPKPLLVYLKTLCPVLLLVACEQRPPPPSFQEGKNTRVRNTVSIFAYTWHGFPFLRSSSSTSAPGISLFWGVGCAAPFLSPYSVKLSLQVTAGHLKGSNWSEHFRTDLKHNFMFFTGYQTLMGVISVSGVAMEPFKL